MASFWFLAPFPTSAAAGDRYALVVTGASGGPEFAQRYHQWRTSFTAVLLGNFGYSTDHVIVLAEEAEPGVATATRENVRSALADLRGRTVKNDVVVVLLIGHGTTDGDEAKFNLVGPDLSADEWSALIKPIAGRIVFVNTSSGSFPFLRKLSGPGRVVLTATDSTAQAFETVFPEFFVKAFNDASADLDKNGKISIWEAFSYTSAGVRGWFTQQGRLATERSLLDDTGRGVGRESQSPGPDGEVARATYLEPAAAIQANPGSEAAALSKRRAEIESEIELLKGRKESMPVNEYQSTLERLMLELARLDRLTRPKS